MDFVFPASDLDRREILLSLLGSHWAQTYQGAELVASYLFARAQLEKQSYQDAQEAVAAMARETVPVFHTRRWHLLTVNESELNGDKVALLRYGDGAVYGNQPVTGVQYKYGVPYGLPDYGFPLPDDLREAPLICNRLTDPSRTWFAGLDYSLDVQRGAIYFRQNPFDDPLFAQREVFTADTITDRQCLLWVASAAFDRQDIYRHWGYLLGLPLESSTAARELVNSQLDAIAQGTAQQQLMRSLQALTGVPLTQENGEIVVDVTTDSTQLLIITDQHVYKFKSTATPIVAVGDTLQADDPLVDAVQLYELNRGEVPENLQALTMGRGFLAAGYVDGITFQNKDVPLEVTTDDDGFTRVQFEVGGFPADVDKFWDDTHTAGRQAGQTLAHLLDQRTA